MRMRVYGAGSLKQLLRTQKVATLQEMMTALGTRSHMTVFRRLQELGYRTSYSHRGKYYTLDSIPKFDERGLWSYREVCFSKLGTLVQTAETFVEASEAGYRTRELDEILAVSTKKTLQKLAEEERIAREQISGGYLYCAAASARRRRQFKARQILEAEVTLGHGVGHLQVSVEELRGAMILAYSLLDEKQRRLCAGLDSLRLGYGGDRKIADILGIDVQTVVRGRRELLAGQIDPERVRTAGGGRKPVKKN